MMPDENNDNVIESYTERIQSEIRHCPYCQTYDSGDLVWIFGYRIDLDELFDQFEVPEDLRDEIERHLTCPHCGADIRRPTDVGVRFDHEIQHDKRIEDALEKHHTDLIEFSYHLRTYPYLGASHPLGTKIIDEISNFPKTSVCDELWFRARRIINGNKYAPEDMRPPDPNSVHIPEGRYNHFGQPYWYLANTKEAAAAEAIKKEEQVAWLQQVEIKNLINILDVRAWEADDDKNWTPDSELRELSLI